VNKANQTHLYQNNKTGVTGLTRREKSKAWICAWRDATGYQAHAYFADKRWGKERAREMAVLKLETELV
jgi:hypothetical protein